MAKQSQDGQEIVRFTVANLVDKTVDGKNLLDFEFHYRRCGASAEEVPTKYRVIFGGKINKAPREVVNHLKKLAYDQYDQKKNDVGETYVAKVGEQSRFMVSEVA